MHTRFYDFFLSNQLLNDNQYGFRPEHSTYMALLRLIDKVSQKMDDKFYSVGIFLDLSKAFDTIGHSILLDKLYCYSVSAATHIAGLKVTCRIFFNSPCIQYTLYAAQNEGKEVTWTEVRRR